MSATDLTQTDDCVPYAITIPSNATTIGATIKSLLQTAGAPFDHVIAIKICRLQPASQILRPAFQIARQRPGTSYTIATTDFTTHGKIVPVGDEHYWPASRGWDASVMALDTTAFLALCEVYF